VDLGSPVFAGFDDNGVEWRNWVPRTDCVEHTAEELLAGSAGLGKVGSVSKLQMERY
jgi:hypothetical protein